MPRISHGAISSSEEINRRAEAVHSINAGLNLPFAIIAAPELTPFDYMFPALQDVDGALLPADKQTVNNLKLLGRRMIESDNGPERDSATPAAYTYFGQFLDHEITFDVKSGALAKLDDPNLAPLPPGTVHKKVVNGRSPRLDLDCVYGPMPDGGPAPRDGIGMLLGAVSKTGGRPPGKDDFNDLPRKPRSKDPKTDREALIGDARNDENLIVAQLHVAFLRAHNTLIARGRSFSEARRTLRQHFQWLVVHDFLKRVAAPEIVNEILEDGNRFYRPSADRIYMPLEFSAAAYRFGHSMVRNEYSYNLNFERATLEQLFTLTALSGNLNPAGGKGFDTLPENWIIEWEDFLDGGRNKARRIDTRLGEPLFALRDFAGKPLPDEAMLSVRNLLRGYLLRVPTGQAAAKAIGVQEMSPARIERAAGEAQALVLKETRLSTRTPLWYYILVEAADQLPDHLGPVGSTIVAETIIGLTRLSEDSILREPGWKPTLGPTPGRFTLRDFLRFAGVLQRHPDTSLTSQKQNIN